MPSVEFYDHKMGPKVLFVPAAFTVMVAGLSMMPILIFTGSTMIFAKRRCSYIVPGSTMILARPLRRLLQPPRL